MAITSSVLFVLLAAALVFVPAPYVTWRPGIPVDVLGTKDDTPLISVSGVETHPVSGRLLLTVVSTSKSSSRISLPEAMQAYFADGSDAMPRDLIYPPGKSDEEITQEAVASMDSSRQNATVAALRAAGIAVTERPMIEKVLLNGPSGGLLQPGDLVLSLDGESVSSEEEISNHLRTVAVGASVEFEVLRDGELERVTVVAGRSPQDQERAVVGVGLTEGFEYAARVAYGVSPDIVGPSAGLVFALGIYDHVTPGSLMADLTVAGTGVIDPRGQVRPIGGIQQKIKGAEEAGATLFFLPWDNCQALDGVQTKMRLVPVSTLRDAIAALQYIQEGNQAEVASCE
ncbi:PDZ domain-containing protein [Tessaracoccus sp. OH4464_COT-324]|uniref:YlbL family protein n=1 Tax=Tessaracoccus sp. OH4464_COT-324 TaxID=2491059 RepID=UPI000FA68D9F|nr:S16 family serine protease [Tessaracoccus sp. OH4464_COT-324]RRD47450.1 PDZ domain-containing protein [Tessaracoccus sp. OH4464_COT-324]